MPRGLLIEGMVSQQKFLHDKNRAHEDVSSPPRV